MSWLSAMSPPMTTAPACCFTDSKIASYRDVDPKGHRPRRPVFGVFDPMPFHNAAFALAEPFYDFLCPVKCPILPGRRCPMQTNDFDNKPFFSSR